MKKAIALAVLLAGSTATSRAATEEFALSETAPIVVGLKKALKDSKEQRERDRRIAEITANVLIPRLDKEYMSGKDAAVNDLSRWRMGHYIGGERTGRHILAGSVIGSKIMRVVLYRIESLDANGRILDKDAMAVWACLKTDLCGEKGLTFENPVFDSDHKELDLTPNVRMSRWTLRRSADGDIILRVSKTDSGALSFGVFDTDITP